MDFTATGSASAADADASLEKGKLRINRACDLCRKKKIKCSGGTLEDPCERCKGLNTNCTFEDKQTKRGPSKNYVETLQKRLEMMETVLHRMSDNPNVSMRAFGDYLRREETKTPQSASSTHSRLNGLTPSRIVSDSAQSSSDNAEEPTKMELMFKEIITEFDDLSLEGRFVGQGSSLTLYKKLYEMTGNRVEADESETTPPVFLQFTEAPLLSAPPLQVIAPDLLDKLTDAIFEHVNPICNVLHRPSFVRARNSSLISSNQSFINLVYIMCALGSRFVDDPRIPVDAELNHNMQGLHYYRLASRGLSVAKVLNVFDLQCYVFILLWLMGNGTPFTLWVATGAAVRHAVDVGAHKENRSRWGVSPIENELRKRAFWMLVSLDEYASSALCRPSAIQLTHVDVALPLPLTDEQLERWDRDPDAGPPTPDAERSLVTATIHYITLCVIIGRVKDRLYGPNHSSARRLSEADVRARAATISRFDSELNAWLTSLPLHLRWDNPKLKRRFLAASLHLGLTYYYTQILMHRDFVSLAATGGSNAANPVFGMSSGYAAAVSNTSTAASGLTSATSSIPSSSAPPGPLPNNTTPSATTPPVTPAGSVDREKKMLMSMLICNNAARSCAQLLHRVMQENYAAQLYWTIVGPAITSGLILLVNVFADDVTFSNVSALTMASIYYCMDVLKNLAPNTWNCWRAFLSLSQLARLASHMVDSPTAGSPGTLLSAHDPNTYVGNSLKRRASEDAEVIGNTAQRPRNKTAQAFLERLANESMYFNVHSNDNFNVSKGNDTLEDQLKNAKSAIRQMPDYFKNVPPSGATNEAKKAQTSGPAPSGFASHVGSAESSSVLTSAKNSSASRPSSRSGSRSISGAPNVYSLTTNATSGTFTPGGTFIPGTAIPAQMTLGSSVRGLTAGLGDFPLSSAVGDASGIQSTEAPWPPNSTTTTSDFDPDQLLGLGATANIVNSNEASLLNCDSNTLHSMLLQSFGPGSGGKTGPEAEAEKVMKAYLGMGEFPTTEFSPGAGAINGLPTGSGFASGTRDSTAAGAGLTPVPRPEGEFAFPFNSPFDPLARTPGSVAPTPGWMSEVKSQSPQRASSAAPVPTQSVGAPSTFSGMEFMMGRSSSASHAMPSPDVLEAMTQRLNQSLAAKPGSSGTATAAASAPAPEADLKRLQDMLSSSTVAELFPGAAPDASATAASNASPFAFEDIEWNLNSTMPLSPSDWRSMFSPKNP